MALQILTNSHVEFQIDKSNKNEIIIFIAKTESDAVTASVDKKAQSCNVSVFRYILLSTHMRY